MSKAMQSIDTAISSTGALRSGAGRRTERDESGAFSQLLSTRQAQAPERNEARDLRESGSSLPEERQQDTTGRTAERDGETPAADLDADRATGQPQPDDGTQDETSVPNVAEASVESPDALHAAPGTDAEEPAMQDVTQVALAAVQSETPPDIAEAADTGQKTATAVTAGDAGPDNMRRHAPADQVGHAVREGVMQMLASRATHGNGGESLASGGNEQSASYEQPAAARGAAGVASFTDALLETGTTTPSARVQVPVGQPGWGRAVGEQVTWFVAQNIRSASLRLNPQHLGPLELRLNMDGDKASIAFASQHAAVRDALESSLPRLRDMFAEQGLNLVNVNVSQRDVSGRREHAADGHRNGAAARATHQDEQLQITGGVPGMVTAQGLVDYYV